ncbi:MAG TPA: hypothetical protein OIM50_03090 [Clostridiaceae bacterium]|jgi:hypothetical protein|nr:hypothetical protein [Clostridiaceae bacterium]
MKVLFAVGNEKISEAIIKEYQQNYKEIITGKNVYYFNAIQKELQKDKSYDRIIISEDLEAFSNNNYDEIDRFIFGKLDNISDEAANNSGEDIPIILICNDRRNKSETFLVKIFGIGIYNALMGQNRSIAELCKLLNKPRTKKEAKIYYKIESEDVDYKVENEEDVSETEIQNIINHYKKLGKNEEKYIESFNSIATQYTDAQLRLIAQFLPLNVKAVLEARCEKYQKIVSYGSSRSSDGKNKKTQTAYEPPSVKVKKIKSNINDKEENKKIKLIEEQLKKNKLTKPVIIPEEVNVSNVKKVKTKPIEVQEKLKKDQLDEKEKTSITEEIKTAKDMKKEIEETPLRKRGRPKKETIADNGEVEPQIKKKRGRPRKEQSEIDNSDIRDDSEPKDIVNLFDMDEEKEDDILPGFEDLEETTLPGLDDKLPESEEIEENDNILPGFEESNEKGGSLSESNEEQQNILPGFEDFSKMSDEDDTVPKFESLDRNEYTNKVASEQEQKIEPIKNTDIDMNLSSLLTKDKKIVAFVGTSKNGTSFIVNNIAQLLSEKGIKTAILDLTKNKNAYYVYTDNQEELRQTAISSIPNLINGIVEGIVVNKNLSVFTTLPNENDVINNYSEILETLIKNYSLILLDCDFETNFGYFKEAQEIYLVQSFDVLTIQPLTAFLRDLKAKNILNPEKLRIILNKSLRVRNVTDKLIIGGISVYNDPAMSYMTELFNKDLIKYCSIPFEEQTYSRYLEGLVECKISLKGYSKKFLMYLSKLGNMVYPLINSMPQKSMSNYNNIYKNSESKFTNQMNETLNKMKNKY